MPIMNSIKNPNKAAWRQLKLTTKYQKKQPQKTIFGDRYAIFGATLFGDVDVGLAMGSIKIEGRCNSDMAGGNECQS